MTKLEAQDRLEDRLEQAFCTATFFLSADNSRDITPRIMSGAIWTMQALIEEARQAFRDMCGPPVMLPEDPDPIDNLEHETLEVLRETVAEIENVLLTGKTLLEAVDKVRKAA